MAVFKCKMCGGTLELNNNESVAVCEYCGTKQTLPRLDDERKVSLFNRANNLRIKSEFDKAAGIYESIIAEYPDEAEAYWGLVLCKFGIEYVDDKNGTKVPTCHRTMPISIMKDDDFQQACENANISAKVLYRDEAKAIDAIQKKILEIAASEEPYDIFICYKETDEITGERTEDSSLAQDIYTALTEMGYKVFYARNTLRRVAGKEYEPYIYSALSSAKVMLAVGTKYEYYDAVWVKNEWSRFISMISSNPAKVLIPCFKNMDAYDIPEEFSNMQALDMADMMFFNSLEASVKRVLPLDTKAKIIETPVANTSGNPTVDSLLERAFIFLEDREWDSANEYCEKVLDIEPKNAQAYLGKLLAEKKVAKKEGLRWCDTSVEASKNYYKVISFGDEALVKELTGYIKEIKDATEKRRIKNIYDTASRKMGSAVTEDEFKAAARDFSSIKEYENSAALARECIKKAEFARREGIYEKANSLMLEDEVSKCEIAIEYFELISGWKDVDEKILACKRKIEDLKVKAEADRIERERKEEEDRIESERKAEEECKQAEEKQRNIEAKKKKNKMLAISLSSVVAVVLVFAIILTTVIIPTSKYNKALSLMEDGKYSEAVFAFADICGFSDSFDKLMECNYSSGKFIITSTSYQTFARKSDNTVVATKLVTNEKNDMYKECDVSEWNDIVAIEGGISHIVGLKSDGTVVAAGSAAFNPCDVEDWTDIVLISAGEHHTVGLKSDGTVVAAGWDGYGITNVESWEDIIDVAAGDEVTVGLKADGTVITTNDQYKYKVNEWKDVVSVSAGSVHIAALKSDGTVVAAGKNSHGQCDVSDWKDIVAISLGRGYTVGLKSDGTVVAVGDNYDGQCDVSNWTDIVAISANNFHTVGLKSDGTVVFTGAPGWGKEDVSCFNASDIFGS